jgi:hypothetical protein
VTALTAVGGVALATAFGVSLAIPSAASTIPTNGHDDSTGYGNPGLSTDPHSQPQQQQPQPQPQPQPLDGGGVPHALSGGS